MIYQCLCDPHAPSPAAWKVLRAGVGAGARAVVIVVVVLRARGAVAAMVAGRRCERGWGLRTERVGGSGCGGGVTVMVVGWRREGKGGSVARR